MGTDEDKYKFKKFPIKANSPKEKRQLSYFRIVDYFNVQSEGLIIFIESGIKNKACEIDSKGSVFDDCSAAFVKDPSLIKKFTDKVKALHGEIKKEFDAKRNEGSLVEMNQNITDKLRKAFENNTFGLGGQKFAEDEARENPADFFFAIYASRMANNLQSASSGLEDDGYYGL